LCPPCCLSPQDHAELLGFCFEPVFPIGGTLVASVFIGTMSVKRICLSDEEGNRVILDHVLEKFADKQIAKLKALILLMIECMEPPADGVMFCLPDIATLDTVNQA